LDAFTEAARSLRATLVSPGGWPWGCTILVRNLPANPTALRMLLEEMQAREVVTYSLARIDERVSLSLHTPGL
jgi:hypothetical protein